MGYAEEVQKVNPKTCHILYTLYSFFCQYLAPQLAIICQLWSEACAPDRNTQNAGTLPEKEHGFFYCQNPPKAERHCGARLLERSLSDPCLLADMWSETTACTALKRFIALESKHSVVMGVVHYGMRGFAKMKRAELPHATRDHRAVERGFPGASSFARTFFFRAKNVRWSTALVVEHDSSPKCFALPRTPRVQRNFPPEPRSWPADNLFMKINCSRAKII